MNLSTYAKHLNGDFTMPKPHSFESLASLHAAISDRSVQHSLERFAEGRTNSVYDLVKNSVVGNTFRAFAFSKHHIDLKPSGIFRSWTTQYLEHELPSILQLPSFDAMIDHVCVKADALDKAWHESTGGVDAVRIGFGRAAKLLGLSLKHLLWHSNLTDRQREHLIPILSVPLDSYTLQGIRLVALELEIPANATMKFIRDAAHYRAVQLRIRELLPFGSHPIHYEIAAWNLAHRSVR